MVPQRCKIDSRHWLWNRVSKGGLDSLLCWSYSGGEAEDKPPCLSACTLEFTLIDERVREQDLTVVCACVPNDYSECTPFLESMGGVLQDAPTGDFIVLLGDSSAHMGNDSLTWRGVIGRNVLPDLNSSCV